MSVVCRTEIELGDYFFDSIHEAKVKSSWKSLTDTATIKLPKVLSQKNAQKKAQDIVKRGDAVKISFGYDDRIVERFRGYMATVKPGMPMTFSFEDEMFHNKEISVAPKSWKAGVTVDDILKYIGIKKYELLGDVKVLGDFTLNQNTQNAAQALLKLKDCIGLPVFYRNGTLNVGDPYKAKNPNKVYLAFGHNIISHKLEYKDKNEVKIKVVAISNKRNGKKLKVELGDHDGELHTLNFPEMAEGDLRKIAQPYLDKLKYSGWRGKMTLFGEPVVQHGDIVCLTDPDKEIEGNYYVDDVESTSSVDGIRQELTIGPKAA